MRIKNKEKIKARIEKRKKQILDAASLVFSKEGFAKANTDEIAKKAKLGKGTIYRYFKDKKDLFLCVVDRGLNKLKENIFKETEKINDPLLRIEMAARTYLLFFEKNEDFVAILMQEQSAFRERITKRYFEHYYGNIDRIKKTFKEALEKKLIKNINIDEAISILTSMLNGLIYMWQIEGKQYRLSDRADTVLKIFFTGIIKDKKRREKYENAKLCQ